MKSSCFPYLFPFGICRFLVKLHLKTPASALQAKANTGSLLDPLLAREKNDQGPGVVFRAGLWAKTAGVSPGSAGLWLHELGQAANVPVVLDMVCVAVK